jgi:hypothetical protein
MLDGRTGWVGALVVVAVVGCVPVTGPDTVAACSVNVAQSVNLAVGAYLSVDPTASGGCIALPANASTADSAEYLLVPQSASGVAGTTSPFVLQGGPGSLTAFVTAHAGTPPPARRLSAAQAFDLLLRQTAATGSYGAPPAATGPAPLLAPPLRTGPPTVGDVRMFTVCANLACSHFKNVVATVQTVGIHVAVYVDNLAPANGLNAADLDTLTSTFDARLYPIDTTAFGRETDVDANGIVIVLMTGVVNALVTAEQCNTSGYISGFFYSADLAPTIRTTYNNGEVFYTIVADPGGTLSCDHTRGDVKQSIPGTLTHEFQHMINYGQHVLVHSGISEHGWLDEGLSKYAEELAATSYLPADSDSFSRGVIDDLYDAYQYLGATGTNPLLIPEDDGTLAEIGASWLFVRYLVDQFGASLPRRLDQSALTGAANVTAATGQPYVTLVTRWALADWVSGLSVPGFTARPELAYSSWDFRTTFASLHAQDPSDFPLAFPLVPPAAAGAALSLSGTLMAGSGMYVRALQGPGASGFTFSFRANGSTALPSTITPRLSIIRIR